MERERKGIKYIREEKTFNLIKCVDLKSIPQKLFKDRRLKECLAPPHEIINLFEIFFSWLKIIIKK
jgi:hypothetical protein